MNRTSVASVLMAMAIALAASRAGMTQQKAPRKKPGGGGTNSTYRVLAYNNLGMHCYDADFSVFSLLPPFNVIQAQVVRRGAPPRLSTGSEVACSYQGVADSNGSINTTSIGKTNFFDHAQGLYGVQLSPDAGILGANMPGPANAPQPMRFAAAGKWFLADGIPITDLDDSLAFNPYPLLRVKAVPRGSKSGGASLDIVVPVSGEMGCADCHATGRKASRRADVQFSQDPDIEVQYRENVLLLHDAVHGTSLFQDKPVLCASCHYSPALDLAGTGPTSRQQAHENQSTAMHRRHGLTLDGKLPDANNPALIPEDGANSCYRCHPGTVTNCLRGVMSSASIQCQNCHGGLLQVAGEFTPRASWADLPKCQSCHTGDAVNHSGPTLPLTTAFTDPLSAAPIVASNKRFAENDNQLYRNSVGHGGVACGGCHGSPHAEWPAQDPNANDNVAANQLQGHIGTITECNVCHTTPPPARLNGPHGMHPVADQKWISSHEDLAERSGAAACKTCHGQDLKGTRLSKTPVARTLRADGRTVSIAAGTQIGCTLCHRYPPD